MFGSILLSCRRELLCGKHPSGKHKDRGGLHQRPDRRDQFEIVTHKYDGMAYTPLTELAQEEARNDERPAFEGQLSSLSGSGLSSLSEAVSNYDIIFIGGPIWWGTYPQVMFTFFDTYDLNGKTIYPFTTHEGSGLGNVMSDVRKAYPNADVKPGFSIYGHEVRTNKAKVEKWINGLNI